MKKERPLPSDFEETLKIVKQRGIVKEGADTIEERVIKAIDGRGATLGANTVKLGVGDWAGSVWREILRAIYKEICDPKQKQLKDKYLDLADKSLTPGGITAVAAAINSIINPAYAVSTIIVLAAIWIIKVGANQWCSYPPPK